MTPERPRTWVFISAMAAATALVALYLWLRARHLQSTGQTIHWLAELWAPSAFLSIVIVTFVEKIVGPAPDSRPRRARPRARKA